MTVRGAGATCETGVTKALAQRLSASTVATRSILLEVFYCYLSDCLCACLQPLLQVSYCRCKRARERLRFDLL